MNGTSRKWLNGFTALYEQPNPKSKKVRDLTEKSLVMARDEVVLWQGVPFVQVEYTDTKVWRGWVYAGMAEDYVESLPKDCVTLADQTPAAHDAEQYIVYNGARQVNPCGQISVAYCLGMPLMELLALWKQEQPAFWARIFKRFGTTAGGTGIEDVISMFAAAKVKAYPLAEAMKDPYLKRVRYTPEWLHRLTGKGQVIASVTINQAGRLEKSGILHWVVVTYVNPERCGYGYVTIYNPFPNRVEVYSWSEFVASAKIPYGVFVPAETL